MRGAWLLGTVGAVLVAANAAQAGVIFSLDTNPPLLGSGVPDPQGLSFATSALDFTSPVFGVANDILGEPNATGGIVSGIVDFSGAVTVGFDVVLANSPGIDVKIFTTQLDPTEGFDLYAGPGPGTLTFLGNYSGSAFTVNPASPLTINVDFNDVVVPVGSQYLRFVNNVPISPLTFGTDFDAVGVNPGSPIPEPGSLTLLGAGLIGVIRRLRQQRP